MRVWCSEWGNRKNFLGRKEDKDWNYSKIGWDKGANHGVESETFPFSIHTYKENHDKNSLQLFSTTQCLKQFPHDMWTENKGSCNYVLRIINFCRLLWERIRFWRYSDLSLQLQPLRRGRQKCWRSQECSAGSSEYSGDKRS